MSKKEKAYNYWKMLFDKSETAKKRWSDVYNKLWAIYEKPGEGVDRAPLSLRNSLPIRHAEWKKAEERECRAFQEYEKIK